MCFQEKSFVCINGIEIVCKNIHFSHTILRERSHERKMKIIEGKLLWGKAFTTEKKRN